MISIKEKTYKYSEIFGRTIQAEGCGKMGGKIGTPTVWVRWWGCNFNCDGFGQNNKNDPESWILPYKDLDTSKYKSMEELPVFNYGCDSSYSWAKSFGHLAHQDTASIICDKLESFMKNRFNPNGLFLHPKSKEYIHLAFTGGEPILSQTAIIDVLENFKIRNNFPNFVTIETNGTQKLREPIQKFIKENYNSSDKEWFWSCSPKLSPSGEKWENAIKPSILKQYNEISTNGQLKFVVDGLDETWDEVDRAVEVYRNEGINWPVCIMPVGARKEEQQDIQAKICEETVDRGFYFSCRVHCFIFNNVIGK